MNIVSILKSLALCMLIPVFSLCQERGIPANFQLQHHIVSARTSSTLFLMGTRLDTFDVTNSNWDPTDSSFSVYSILNSDTLATAVVQLYDAGNNDWNYQIQSLNQYDGAGFKTETILQLWSTTDTLSTWTNAGKTTYVYDNNHYILNTTQYQVDTSGNFIPSSQTIYQYDNLNQLIRQILLSYNSSTMVFDSVQRSDLTYDSAGNKVSEIDYINAAGWTPQFQYLSSYDSSNQLEATIAQLWNGSKYLNNYKDSLDYDSHGNRIALSRYTWDNSQKTFSIYSIRIESSFDANDWLTQEITYYGMDTQWVPLGKANYSYDTEGNNIYTLIQGYDNASSTYINSEQDFYHYAPFTIIGITTVNPDIFHLNIFPNPTSETITAALDMTQSSSVKFQILDNTGRIFSNQLFAAIKGKNNFTVDVTSLSPGIYYLKIMSPVSSKASVVKFVKQ